MIYDFKLNDLDLWATEEVSACKNVNTVKNQTGMTSEIEP